MKENKRKLTVSMTKKTKCEGCLALVKEQDGYSCKLGFAITYNLSNGVYHAPKPDDKCYKPTNSVQMSMARNMVRNKIRRQEKKEN